MVGSACAGGWNADFLALQDAVWIGNRAVGGSEARPGGSVAEMGLRQSPEGIAFPNLNNARRGSKIGSGRAWCTWHSRDNEFGPGADFIWICNPGICSQEFGPTLSATESLVCQSPKRITMLDTDDIFRRKSRGWNRGANSF